MFAEEALWVGSLVNKLQLSQDELVANLGSSTAHFRKVVQPHIHQYIFEPLEKKKIPVVHIDAKEEVGVDIVADITQPGFSKKFAHRFQLVLCTNMLEHVENIQAVINNLIACCKQNGFIMLTVPYKYKKHEDPIDNMFRPKPADITALFMPGQVEEIESKVIVISDKSYYTKKKSHFPIWGYREQISYYLGGKHRVSGVLLQVKK